MFKGITQIGNITNVTRAKQLFNPLRTTLSMQNINSGVGNINQKRMYMNSNKMNSFGNNINKINKFYQSPCMITPAFNVAQHTSKRDFAKIVQVPLPDLGEGTKDATVKEWFVKPGDKISEFDDLVEVFTDKLVAKIPSAADGTVIEIKKSIDEVCLVGHSLMSIRVDDEDGDEANASSSSTSSSDEEAAEPQQAAVQNTMSAHSGPGNSQTKALSTPAVRHLAKKHSLDINAIMGTGKNGRVTKGDVLSFMAGGNQEQPQAQQQVSRSATSSHIVPVQEPLKGITEQDQVKKIRGIQKAMTKTMTESLSIPAFGFSDDMDCTGLFELRRELKQQVPDLTVLPFFMKALSLALTKFPELNSIVNPEVDQEGYIHEYVVKHDHNFSVAIDSPAGLTTPNIKNIQNQSILQLNQSLRSLVDKAKTNQLQASDFESGTFAVSSVGNIGGKYFHPVILRPQAAIITLGKAYKKPNYAGVCPTTGHHLWDPSDTVSFSIAADHRVLDGATVAHFSAAFKNYIENPNLMLISI